MPPLNPLYNSQSSLFNKSVLTGEEWPVKVNIGVHRPAFHIYTLRVSSLAANKSHFGLDNSAEINFSFSIGFMQSTKMKIILGYC